MASVNLLLTPIKVSVGPPKEAPIILLLWGLAVYFYVGRCWFTAVSVAGLVNGKAFVKARILGLVRTEPAQVL